MEQPHMEIENLAYFTNKAYIRWSEITKEDKSRKAVADKCLIMKLQLSLTGSNNQPRFLKLFLSLFLWKTQKIEEK